MTDTLTSKERVRYNEESPWAPVSDEKLRQTRDAVAEFMYREGLTEKEQEFIEGVADLLHDLSRQRAAPETISGASLPGLIADAQRRMDAWPDDVRIAMGLPLKANELQCIYRTGCQSLEACKRAGHCNAPMADALRAAVKADEHRPPCDNPHCCICDGPAQNGRASHDGT